MGAPLLAYLLELYSYNGDGSDYFDNGGDDMMLIIAIIMTVLMIMMILIPLAGGIPTFWLTCWNCILIMVME